MPSPMSGWARPCWRCCRGWPIRRSSQAVRTGGVGYDRLRPLDAYGYWYARTLGWILARALPRAALMLLGAGIVLPLVGLEAWAWQPPAGVTAALLFVVSLHAHGRARRRRSLMLANIVVAASLNERGVNAVLAPIGDRLLGPAPAAATSFPSRCRRCCTCSRSPGWSTSRSASTSPIWPAPWHLQSLGAAGRLDPGADRPRPLRHGARDAPARDAGRADR